MKYDWNHISKDLLNHPSKDTRIANLQFLLGSKIRELIELQGKFYQMQKELDEVKSRSYVDFEIPLEYYDGLESEDCEEAYGCTGSPEHEHGFDRDASHNAGRYVCTCETYYDEGFDDPCDEFITLGMTDYNDLIHRFTTGRIKSLHDLIVEVQDKLREYNT